MDCRRSLQQGKGPLGQTSPLKLSLTDLSSGSLFVPTILMIHIYNEVVIYFRVMSGWVGGGLFHVPVFMQIMPGRCRENIVDVRVAYIRKLAFLGDRGPLVTANYSPLFCSYLWGPLDLNP